MNIQKSIKNQNTTEPNLWETAGSILTPSNAFIMKRKTGDKKRVIEAFSLGSWRGGYIKTAPKEGEGETSKDKGRDK